MLLGISLLQGKYIDQVDRRPIYWCNTESEQTLEEMMERRAGIFAEWLKNREMWLNKDQFEQRLLSFEKTLLPMPWLHIDRKPKRSFRPLSSTWPSSVEEDNQ